MSIKSMLFGQVLKSLLKSLTGKPKWFLLAAAAVAVALATSGIGGDDATSFAASALEMVCGD